MRPQRLPVPACLPSGGALARSLPARRCCRPSLQQLFPATLYAEEDLNIDLAEGMVRAARGCTVQGPRPAVIMTVTLELPTLSHPLQAPLPSQTLSGRLQHRLPSRECCCTWLRATGSRPSDPRELHHLGKLSQLILTLCIDTRPDNIALLRREVALLTSVWAGVPFAC